MEPATIGGLIAAGAIIYAAHMARKDKERVLFLSLIDKRIYLIEEVRELRWDVFRNYAPSEGAIMRFKANAVTNPYTKMLFGNEVYVHLKKILGAACEIMRFRDEKNPSRQNEAFKHFDALTEHIDVGLLYPYCFAGDITWDIEDDWGVWLITKWWKLKAWRPSWKQTIMFSVTLFLFLLIPN